MIITCEKCSKKFNIKDDLIPNEGRELQCGSCNHKWFFKKTEKIFTLENEISEDISINDKFINSNIKADEPNKKIKKEIKFKSKKAEYPNSPNKIKKNPKIIKNSLVFLISIIALIMLLDTFKYQLKNYFPGLDSILNNLYESLKDLILFFKDLIN